MTRDAVTCTLPAYQLNCARDGPQCHRVPGRGTRYQHCTLGLAPDFRRPHVEFRPSGTRVPSTSVSTWLPSLSSEGWSKAVTAPAAVAASDSTTARRNFNISVLQRDEDPALDTTRRGVRQAVRQGGQLRRTLSESAVAGWRRRGGNSAGLTIGNFSAHPPSVRCSSAVKGQPCVSSRIVGCWVRSAPCSGSALARR